MSMQHEASRIALRIVASLDRAGIVGDLGNAAFALIASFGPEVTATASQLGLERAQFARKVERGLEQMESVILTRRRQHHDGLVELGPHRRTPNRRRAA
jgi:hypothetical protein